MPWRIVSGFSFQIRKSMERLYTVQRADSNTYNNEQANTRHWRKNWHGVLRNRGFTPFPARSVRRGPLQTLLTLEFVRVELPDLEVDRRNLNQDNIRDQFPVNTEVGMYQPVP